MRAKTFMSTDWIEIHDHGSVYMARVFLTNENKAYVITNRNGRKRYFSVDAELLKTGELNFFERVMETANEISTNNAIDIGLAK